VTKVGRLRWLGHLFRMHEQNPCRKLTLLEWNASRWAGRPAIRWLDSVEIWRQWALEMGDESHTIGTNGGQS
jgi:hypothetical protein